MKIVLALHQYPPVGTGGTEDLTRWTARALAARGHAAQIVSAVPRRRGVAVGTPAPGLGADGVPVSFLEAGTTPTGTLARIPLEYDDAEAGRAFGAKLDVWRPDVVHFYHLAGLTAASLRAVNERGIPSVVSATDFWFECPTVQLLLPDGSLCEGPDLDRGNCVRHLLANRLPAAMSAHPRWTRALTGAIALTGRAGGGHRVERAWAALRGRSPSLREALAAPALVLAPTAFMHARLERFGIASERLRLLRYGVPTPEPEFRPIAGASRDGRLRVAFVGSLAPNKGPHLLLEAMARIPELAAEVAVFGRRVDEDYAHRLHRLAQADPRVRFAGTFAEGEFGALLARTDVLVIPSLWYENAPLVLLEALAHRCPVLVADVPGLTEPVRPDLDGWTFRRGDARDLATRLAWCGAHPKALDAVRASSFPTRTTTDYMNDLLPIYEEVCAGARGTK